MLIFKTRKSAFLTPIIFLEKHIVSDGMGPGGEITWIDSGIHELAALWPLKSKEIMEGMKLEHQITHRITIHYRIGVKATMRIQKVEDGKIFDVISVIDMYEANEEIQLLAREVT